MLEGALGAAALGSGVRSLWDYNRSNFMLDRQLQQNKMHQKQNMRLSEAILYREDIRDVLGLTVSKMDQYLVLNTLQLGFAISIFYDGRAPRETEAWLVLAYMGSTAGAIAFLILSIWFSIHASVAAQSFTTVILTMAARLPIPSDDVLDKVAGRADDYELKDSQFRLPYQSRKHGTPQDDDLRPMYSSEHHAIYKSIQDRWMTWDSYARVTMSLGTYQNIQALIFLVNVFFVGQSFRPLPFVFLVVLFAGLNVLLVNLDWEFTLWERLIFMGLNAGTLVVAETAIYASNFDEPFGVTSRALSPLLFLLLFGRVVFFCYVASAFHDDGNWLGLPIKFRAVRRNEIFRDIFKNKTPQKEDTLSLTTGAVDSMQISELTTLLAQHVCKQMSLFKETLRKWKHLKDKRLLTDMEAGEVQVWEEFMSTQEKLVLSLSENTGTSLIKPRKKTLTDPFLYIFDGTHSTLLDVWNMKSRKADKESEEVDFLRTREGFHDRLSRLQKQLEVLVQTEVSLLRSPEQINAKAVRARIKQVFKEEISGQKISYNLEKLSKANDILEELQQNIEEKLNFRKTCTNKPWQIFLLMCTFYGAFWLCAFFWSFTIQGQEIEPDMIRSLSLSGDTLFFNPEKCRASESDGFFLVHPRSIVVAGEEYDISRMEESCLMSPDSHRRIVDAGLWEGSLKVWFSTGEVCYQGKTTRLADWQSPQAYAENENSQASLRDGRVVLNPRHREIGENVRDFALSSQKLAILMEGSVTITNLSDGETRSYPVSQSFSLYFQHDVLYVCRKNGNLLTSRPLFPGDAPSGFLNFV